jgi:isoamylase
MTGTRPGSPYPLGATFDGEGTNFCLFSAPAEAVELCLFEGDNECRYPLSEVDAYCWHGYLPGVGPGQRYGYRVDGPYRPEHGLRCNPSKLLIDPYAKAVEGQVRWGQAPYSFKLDQAHHRSDDRRRDTTDSASSMPKSIVSGEAFDWEQDRPPRTDWHRSVLYETHVKGITARRGDIAPELRGTYSGLAQPQMLDYLVDLGVTAVELLPVHQFVQDHRLVEMGLRNYWGYNSIGYLAPHNEYGSTSGHHVVNEFKQMVKSLHRAGLEVILDVVYNHTAEHGRLGPTLSFKGADNQTYYWLDGDPRSYTDFTGTGNSVNCRNAEVLQLIMDSLRYWVTEMHVDGFRFDLATTLARVPHYDRRSGFLDLVHQDPVVSQVKLIAEPWDLGHGGYQVGNFPPPWSEWNGRYRDTIRDYWRQGGASIGELANRLTGSSDLYGHGGRRPSASVNFVTAHDGFTLADLVSYNDKHNHANGEDNRDGTDDNRSWNCGEEGDTSDEAVKKLRRRQQRNFLATLLLSQGVPMLLGGDEIGRTQGGNNNAYCQDNVISWYDWDSADHELLTFTKAVVKFRREHQAFLRRNHFRPDQANPMEAGGDTQPEIAWFRPDGEAMTDHDWGVGYAKSIGVFIAAEKTAVGENVPGVEGYESFLLLINGWQEDLEFILPRTIRTASWALVFDTAGSPVGSLWTAGGSIPLTGHSLALLQRRVPLRGSVQTSSESPS